MGHNNGHNDLHRRHISAAFVVARMTSQLRQPWASEAIVDRDSQAQSHFVMTHQHKSNMARYVIIREYNSVMRATQRTRSFADCIQ